MQTYHLGEAIKKEMLQQNMNVKVLADKIGCNPNNVYNIFYRQSMDTDLLMRISTALNKNFFTEVYKETQYKLKN